MATVLLHSRDPSRTPEIIKSPTPHMARKVKAEQHQHRATHSVATFHNEIYTNPAEPLSSGSTIRDCEPLVDINMDDKSNETITGESLETLGRGVKELVQAVQTLRHLGVEDLVLPLPKIVVVGDQSTGKSSLIEAMSEIKVPRSAGTCTRCPLEINLTEGPSEQWSCKVSIHQKYMYMSKTGKNSAKVEGATRSRPLGPWMQQESQDIHFATIEDACEVEHILFLAQMAILNPGVNPLKYAPSPGMPEPQESYQVKFSPNIIRLDICGRGLTNLSFYDLPGVINVSDVPEEAYLVDLVKNLVKEYVNAEDCINLLAIPLTDDPANSSASKLIRDLHAETRTLGCLTKPDRMQSGESLEQWIQILRGERFHLGYGYHVIKNDPDPQVDHATARVKETAFFNETEPWTTTLRAFYPRFGTLQLQALLSQLLTSQIQKSLPRIQEQVRRKAESIDVELKALPEAIHGNLPVMVMSELGKFNTALQKQIDGGTQDCPFQNDFHELATLFRQTLANSKPVLMLRDTGSHSYPLPTRETPNGSIAGTPTPMPRRQAAAINIDSDTDDESHVNPPSTLYQSGSKRPFKTPNSSPNKFQRTDSVLPGPLDKVQSRCFTLSDVRKIIHRGYISLPGQVDPKAIEELIRISMDHWEKPVEEFLAQIKQLCQHAVLDQVQTVFKHRQHTAYFTNILNVCESFLEEALIMQLHLAKRILTWESSKPKTLNEKAMEQARYEAQTLLLSQRRKVLATPFVEEQERNGKKTIGAQRDEKLAKVPGTELVPETYGPELKAMAETKAYYEVAYSRFVDNLCISIHHELFLKCREQLVPCLEQEFRLLDADANDRMAVLLAVNPRDEERRAVLKKEKATIVKALEQLEALT